MPKVKISARRRVDEFPNEGLITRNSELWCSFCNSRLDFEKKSIISQHFQSQSHLKNKGRAKGKSKRQIHESFHRLHEESEVSEDTWTSMVSAFVAAGIPLHTLDNPVLREWLKKNLIHGQNLPSERTFRRLLIKEGEKDLTRTKEICKDQDVMLMVDETQDFQSRKVVNLLISPVKPAHHFRLLNTEILEKGNAEIIVQFLNRSLQLGEVPLNRVVAVVSDSATYMVEAAGLFIQLTGRCIHITCWSHILHQISEDIRNRFENVDTFIAKMKAALNKAPARRAELQGTLQKNGSESRLPPSRDLTRWTTWLAAADYHSKNFGSVLEWINFTETDNGAVRKLKELIMEPDLESQLQLLSSIYPSISATTKKLEGSDIAASDVLLWLETILALLTSSHELRSSFQKLESYLNEQHPAKEFWKAAEYFDPRKFHKFENSQMQLPPIIQRIFSKEVPLHELACYKSICHRPVSDNFSVLNFWESYKRELPTLYEAALIALSIPPTRADVQRSFSFLNRFFTPERNRFTPENIGIHLRLRFNGRKYSEQELALEEEEEEN